MASIFDALIKPALDSVTGVIEQFHMSPEDKAKYAQAAADAAAKAQQAALDYDVKLNDIAGENIRAETQSADKFTARSRPAFLYVVISVFAFDYILLPLAQIFGSTVKPIELPSDVLVLFGVVMTGYGTLHTIEGIANKKGDSQISILGMKIGQKN
jgi:hypothetical protein